MSPVAVEGPEISSRVDSSFYYREPRNRVDRLYLPASALKPGLQHESTAANTGPLFKVCVTSGGKNSHEVKSIFPFCVSGLKAVMLERR